MRERETFEVVIVGGGPAGAAAAIALARAGRRVLLAEALTAAPAFKIGESLPPAAQPLLRDLGVAERVAGSGHLPSPGIVAAWGSDRPGERDFIRELHGSGWHLDRPRFDASLREAARAAGAEVRLDCRLARWQRAEASGGWDLAFFQRDGARRVSAPWLIDATGRRALIANGCGAPAIREDGLVAFCAVLPAEANASRGDARTFIESTEQGWWYSALLPGDRRLVAFFTDEDLSVARAVHEPAGFLRQLSATRHVRFAAPLISSAAGARIRRFPAASVARATCGGDGWLAIGDATLAFDPLSSQGMFHALYTGLRGAQTVLAWLSGEREGLRAWNDRLGAIHAGYRRHLAQCYAAERRWPDAQFWQRRHRRTIEDRNSASPFSTSANQLLESLS